MSRGEGKEARLHVEHAKDMARKTEQTEGQGQEGGPQSYSEGMCPAFILLPLWHPTEKTAPQPQWPRQQELCLLLSGDWRLSISSWGAFAALGDTGSSALSTKAFCCMHPLQGLV